MKKNVYTGVLEQWQVDLIVGRARRLGFRGPDIEDALQDVAIELMGFRFDPAKANGASEATAMTSFIDFRLSKLRRKERRYREHLERLQQIRPQLPMVVEQGPLALDVREATAVLAPEEQQICRALSEGKQVTEIAETLGRSWFSVYRVIVRIRRRFADRGLEDWIRATEAPKAKEPLLLSARAAAQMCSKSLRTWRAWDSAGLVPAPIRIGRSTLWRAADLTAWIEAGCPKRTA